LPSSGTTVQSSSAQKKNRAYISKAGQPESVPLLSFVDVGSADDEIVRVLALQDAVYYLKEDGVYRMTGTSRSNFDVSEFDRTAVIKGEETAVVLNNQIWCYSTQGVISISTSGVQVVSRPIEDDLLSISSDLFSDFETIAFGVAYETERQYQLWVPTATTDTYATQAHIYNTFTAAWTLWTGDRKHAVVLREDDKLYQAQADTFFLRQERKNRTVEDYAEDEFAVVLSSSSTTEITLVDTSDIVAGQSIAQEITTGVFRQAKVVSVDSATVITVDRNKGWIAGAAKVYNAISQEVTWTPIHGGNPGMIKQQPMVALFFRNAEFRTVDVKFSSDFADESTVTSIESVRTGAFGVGTFGIGTFGGGLADPQPIATYVPAEQQIGHWLNMTIEHNEALTRMALAGYSLGEVQPQSAHFR